MGNIYSSGRKSTGIDALKFVEKMESMGAGEILLLLWIEMEQKEVMI